MKSMTRILHVASVAALVAAAISPCSPAHAGATYELKACVHKKTGAVRVVIKRVKCTASEQYIDLHQKAPVIPMPSALLSGPTPPSDGTTGYDGDFYLDTSAVRLYGPRVRGAWGAGTSLVGATGATGPIGATGAAGARGDVGPAGPKGETGTAGSPGRDGNDGARGAPGATGGVGPAGAVGPKGETGTVADLHYGSFYDTGTVALAQNVATPVPLRITDFAYGVSVTYDTQTPAQLTVITMGTAGKYNIAFSLQLLKTGGGTDIASIWLRKNGVDVDWTSTDVYLVGSSARQVAAWNFFVNANAGDAYQLMIAAGDSTTSILAGSGANPPTTTRPQIPSTILTVNQVG